ncbi:MAG TPA: leucyl aminopeptidase family protein [Acidiferrobacterales bacterium]|nr:leucyl aminopeptidase family protein [Acidiferrobacterales bacterium]
MQLDIAKITQDGRTLSTKDADSGSHLVCLLAAAFDIARLPHGSVLKQRMKAARHKLAADSPFHTILPNTQGTRISLLVIDPAQSAFELLTQARKTIAHQRNPAPTILGLACFGLDAKQAERAGEALIAAALAADFTMPDFKSKREPAARLKQIRIYGHKSVHGYVRTLAEARGNNLARFLTALPPNELTPGSYRLRVVKLARTYGWKTEFLDSKKLKARGAGAFLAVAQGSPEPDAGILHLRYAPKKKSSKGALALVGKGICFDTGGTNLKPARHMHGMHEDMEGSAVALGTLLALTELKVDFPVDCWLALAQNHIGPKAYKQNDVVTAANGTTIEIMHTDAEGRMVLADTLTFASRAKPRLIMDYATLTGSCVGALSTRMSGAVTNRMELVPTVIEAGWESGERVWPFPLEKDYDKALKSGIADVKQCTLDSDADHIIAAAFLRKFIEGDMPWVHIDLSAGNHKGGLAHIPTDITGFGVRFSLNLLLNQKVI